MCVFSVSKRRRSWILGQAVSLWAGVLCNHTHTNTLRTATSSPGQGCREGGTASPLPIHTPTHSSLIAFRVPPLSVPPPFTQQGGGARIVRRLTFLLHIRKMALTAALLHREASLVISTPELHQTDWYHSSYDFM